MLFRSFAAVLAWVGPDGTVDRAFVEETVCLGSPLRGATWIEGVRLLDPATELRVTRHDVSTRRYWRWEALPEPGTVRVADPVTEAYERWREVIAKDAPHVLLFFDVGMDPGVSALAANRLAPVQCMSIAHPVTTG